MSTSTWNLGDVIGHNDAAPYNAVWHEDTGELVGFVDWDFAGPCAPISDLAFVVFSWVPLRARSAAREEGFTDFEARPQRLDLLLDAYGYSGTKSDLFDAMRARVSSLVKGIRELAGTGDPLFQRLINDGSIGWLQRSLVELEEDRGVLGLN